MKNRPEQLQIQGVPPCVASWSAVSIPGFVPAVLDRWRRNHGELPARFIIVICPKVEVNAIGGRPAGRCCTAHQSTPAHAAFYRLSKALSCSVLRRRGCRGMLQRGTGAAFLVGSLRGGIGERCDHIQFVQAIEERD